MGVDFAIDLEPDTGDPGQLSEEEIAAYYRTHCPTGTAPLAAIREHVACALAAERAAGRPDPTKALHARFVDDFGRDKIWWDPQLEEATAQLGVAALRSFQVCAPQWCDAAEGLRTVRALQGFLREAHPERGEQLACLGLVEQILAHAEQRRRRFRLLALW